jgi:hypothetical protein
MSRVVLVRSLLAVGRGAFNNSLNGKKPVNCPRYGHGTWTGDCLCDVRFYMTAGPRKAPRLGLSNQ